MSTTQLDAQTAMPRVSAAVERILRAFASFTPEQAHQAPGGDDWDAARVLAHTAEILPYWSHQAAAVAARPENGQPFGRSHDDPDRIEAVERGAKIPIEQLREQVRQQLTDAEQVLRGIPAAGWAKTAVHSRRGEMTVSDIVGQFLVDHAEEHCHQAEEIAATVKR